MYGIRVFDYAASRWRKVVVAYVENKDEVSLWCYAFDERRPSEYDTLVDAWEDADGLVSDSLARVGIFDLATEELVFNSAAPVDLSTHPMLHVIDEGAWIRRFSDYVVSLRPALDKDAARRLAETLYPAHQTDLPEQIATDELGLAPPRSS